MLNDADGHAAAWPARRAGETVRISSGAGMIFRPSILIAAVWALASLLV